MSISTYNTDKRYEMMAAILPGENENKPDAEQIIEDLQEILKLCYAYTTTANTPNEFTASDLGEAIVDYLFTQWTGVIDFEPYAVEFWNPPKPGAADPASEVDDTPTPDGMLIP